MSIPEQAHSRAEASGDPGRGSDGDRFRLVMEIFREVVAAPAPIRQRIIDRRTGHDAALKAEVEAMLRHDAQPSAAHDEAARAIRTGAGLGLGEPSPRLDAVGLSDFGPSIPRLAGHYRIVRVIGEGGMGVVYEAEQTIPRRVVAVKAIRSGLMGQQVLRWFAREAHILGRLAHPGIAQIYEAGVVEDGPADQAYLVMEYVDGHTLTEHATDRGLGVRERMELMARVCDAVQHAHQRRVIHRDLKPGNILVDKGGQPKVLDFGVAALATDDAEDGASRDTTLETLGPHVVGTLAYMAPEQLNAEAEGGPDTRSDVYSLGVILYELLSGRLPLAVRGMPFADAAKVIQTDRPARLGSIDRSLRGDPETIAGKAIQRERAARYQSAAEMAEDLRRCIAGEPIVARSSSLGYVLRTTVRRHRVVVSLASAALLAISGLGVYTGVAAVRASRLARELTVQLSDSRIERAKLLARTGQAGAAEDALWSELAHRPDSKLARWALWDLYSRSPCLATLPSCNASAFDVAFSPDGSLVAIANRPAGKVEAWDPSFTRLVRTFDVGSERVLAVAFSPDGTRMATGDADGRLTLWSVADGSPVVRREAHEKGVGRVLYSPDGNVVATAGRDARVGLWNAGDGEPLRDLSGHAASIDAIAFSPDSRTIVSGSQDATVRVWDVASGECTRTLTSDDGLDRGTISALAFSPDGTRLYAGGVARTLTIWDARTLQRQVRCDDLPRFPYSIALAADGRTMYLACDAIEVRDAIDGRLLRTLTYADGSRRGLALSPVEDRLVTVSMRGRVMLLETREQAGRTVLGTGGFCTLAFSPDGTTLAGPGASGAVRLMRVGHWSEHRDLVGHSAALRAVAYLPDGKALVSGAQNGEARVWDLAGEGGGTAIASAMVASEGLVSPLAVSPDGRTLLTGSTAERAALWTLPGLDPAGEIDLAELALPSGRVFALSAAWSPDSQRLSIGMGAHVLGVWRAGNPRPELKIVVQDPQTSLAFSPDGRHLLIGGDKTIFVADAYTGAIQRRLTGQAQMAVGLAFTEPGLLISASRDRTIRLWDWPSALPLLTLDAGAGQPFSLAVSRDGRWAACMVDRGGMVVWDLAYYNRHVAGNASWNLGRIEDGISETTRQHLEEQLRRQVTTETEVAPTAPR